LTQGLQPVASWRHVAAKSCDPNDVSIAMRPSLIAARLIAGSLMSLALLVACQMTAPGASPMAADEISVTPLDALPETAPTTDTAHPKPRPDTATEPTAPDDAALDPVTTEPVTSEPAAEPEAPKSAEQVLCETAGGQWAVAGKTGAFICVSPTRDGGKACHKKGDCEGLCLARSGTCAPFSPLFGCNEVLEKDGRRVTLCID
jgi:hypothetical protein